MVSLHNDFLLVKVCDHVLKITVLVIDPFENIVVESRIPCVTHYLFHSVHAHITWLIFLISGAIGVAVLPDRALVTKIVWALSVLCLVTALSCVAFRDPGILRRHPEKPEPNWRWNDQARTFRPPGAWYDEDLGLVVEGFDHVCPWTGTGIGQRNMGAFHCFVTLLCVCIVLDVLIVMRVMP